jgi:hypothetical protein
MVIGGQAFGLIKAKALQIRFSTALQTLPKKNTTLFERETNQRDL